MLLGALALVPSGLVLAGLQIPWFSPNDAAAVPLVCAASRVPLQLVASSSLPRP